MSNKKLIKVSEKELQKELSGKIYIVTGANGGVGFETTRQLIKQGAHVVMACRRVDAGKTSADAFRNLKGSYEVMKCDLSDLESVRTFVSEFLKKHDRLDALVCNAGMLNWDNTLQFTKDGFEKTWAANFFGHFLMTELLLDILKKSAPSRIVFVSSAVIAGKEGNRPIVQLEDLEYKNRSYNNQAVYAEVKLAETQYAMELAERLKDTGVITASVHPGWAKSNFGNGGSVFNRVMMKVLTPLMSPMMDSTWDSSQTSLHVLLSDDVANHSGEFFSQYSVAYADKESKNGGWPMRVKNSNAYDMDAAQKLVEKSRQLVGLK